MYLIAYDITDPRRLHRTARALKRYGRRVQKSLFEADISRSQCKTLCRDLSALCREGDRITVYFLPGNPLKEEINEIKKQ